MSMKFQFHLILFLFVLPNFWFFFRKKVVYLMSNLGNTLRKEIVFWIKFKNNILKILFLQKLWFVIPTSLVTRSTTHSTNKKLSIKLYSFNILIDTKCKHRITNYVCVFTFSLPAFQMCLQ